jgi:predicted small lipoprotein YifL
MREEWTSVKGGTIMKLRMIAVTALFALAACGQSGEAPKQEAPPAPQGLMEQLERTSPEMQPVTAWQQLMTHAETMPACREVRHSESRGIVPANAGGPYAGHGGEWVFSVQCGPQLTTVRPDPHQHWLIFFAPGATTSTIVNCADAHGVDQCAAAQIPIATP